MKKVVFLSLILFSQVILFQGLTLSYADAVVYESIGIGRQTVTTAGTRVQLNATSTSCTRIVITAETDNTGIITVGGASVVGALATREGTPLAAGDSVTLYVNNLNKVYIDSTVDSDGVSYVYYR